MRFFRKCFLFTRGSLLRFSLIFSVTPLGNFGTVAVFRTKRFRKKIGFCFFFTLKDPPWNFSVVLRNAYNLKKEQNDSKDILKTIYVYFCSNNKAICEFLSALCERSSFHLRVLVLRFLRFFFMWKKSF